MTKIKKYTKSKKEKLIENINKLQTKEQYIKLYEIIQKRKDHPSKQIGNSTVMFFHDLDNETYYEIEMFLKENLKTTEKRSSEATDEYKPYSQDDFPDEKEMSPKLKYSNREKNLIKRKRYDQTLNEENGSDYVYCEFDIKNLSENKNES